MAKIRDIDVTNSDDIKKGILESSFSKLLLRMKELDFDPQMGGWRPETKDVLARCGLINLDKDGKIIPFSIAEDLDKEIKKRVSTIINILKYCVDNNIEIRATNCDVTQLMKQMIADGVITKTNKKVNMDAINFIRQNKEIDIVTPEAMKRYSDVIDIISGKKEIEPGRTMKSFESIALFDYATPIIRDRFLLVRQSTEIPRYPSIENTNGYYDFLNTITAEITKATGEEAKRLKELRKQFVLEIGKEIAVTVKTFTREKKNMSMEMKRARIAPSRLGISEGLVPFLYDKHIPAENFDELISTVVYLEAAKKYNDELTGIGDLSEKMRGKRPIHQDTTPKKRFNVYSELARTFGLSDSNMISDFLSQGRNAFAFEKFMASRLEYEYEKINIERQLKDMIKAYPQLKDVLGPVEVFRAGVLDENGSMSAKKREQIYSSDKHVESGSKIQTAYISLTESPLIMGQFLYPFNSTNDRAVPTVVDIRVIYNSLLNRYQELENGNFKFAGQERFVECLKQFAGANPERKNEILKKLQLFEKQKKDAIPYERNMELPEGFVSRECVERFPNTYSGTSAELLLKGIIPAESITQMDYLTADILQMVCNTDAFDSVLNESRKRNHNIIESLKKFIKEERNLEELGLDDYELDFIKQYYINGTPLEKIISVPDTQGAEIPELIAIGTAIRNAVSKKLLNNDRFLNNCLNVNSKEAEIIKRRMQDLYTAKMSKTSERYTDKPIIAKDKKANSGLYMPFESDYKKKYIVAEIKIVPKDRPREITIRRYSKVPYTRTVEHKVRNGISTVNEKDYRIETEDEIFPFEVRYQSKNAAKKMKETSIVYHMESKAQEADDREDNIDK